MNHSHLKSEVEVACAIIEQDLEPELVALMLGIGIPLSFLTLAGWWWIMA